MEEKKYIGLSKEHLVLLISCSFAIIFAAVGVGLAKTPKLYGFFLGLGVIIAFVPYSLLLYFKTEKTKAIEEHFPSFLRDIAESKKSGMTIPQAVYKSSQTDYGALSPEISKMSSQISWGIPFNDVFKRFAGRIKSEFIDRAVAIIIEAQVSGGAISDALDAVASDARLIKQLEKERRSKLNQQVLIMYAIFFLFLAIVIALHRLMIPLVASRGFSLATEDPVAILSFYRNLFFSMIVIQAIFNGLLAGQIGQGSVAMGLKHSAIFLIGGVFIAFMFLF